MRPTAAGIYPNFIRGSPVLDAQVLAATPLGKDAAGANLTAYIVRSDEEAPAPPAKNTANTNETSAPSAASFAENLVASQQAVISGQTSAKFLKPDSLLTRLEKAQVDHLRARDTQIKKEVSDAKTTSSASFVYQSGPDGRNYIVGVAAPLVMPNADLADEGEVPKLSEREHDRGISAYQTALGNAAPLRANRANEAF
jgi:hypothetical protein